MCSLLGPSSCTQYQCPRGEAVLSVGDGDKGPSQVVAETVAMEMVSLETR